MPKLPCSPVSMAPPPPHRLSNRAGSGGCWRWWWPHQQQLIKAFLLLRPTDEHTGPDPTHDSCPPIFVPTQISFSRKYSKDILMHQIFTLTQIFQKYSHGQSFLFYKNFHRQFFSVAQIGVGNTSNFNNNNNSLVIFLNF